jgi:hypothetical protein
MSFADRLMLWFHVAFVVFTIGPVTIAIMSTPRYIRTRNVPVLRYLLRLTRIFGVASLGVLVFGIALGQSLSKLGKGWLTVSMTLFVVSLVLLVLIMRDQRRAIVALETAATDEALSAVRPAAQPSEHPGADADAEADGDDSRGGTDRNGARPPAPAAAAAPLVATVERGRIASLGGIVSLIWLAILVLMIWNT